MAGVYVPRASDVRITEIDMSQVVTNASTSVVAQVLVSTQGSPTPQLWTDAQSYMTSYGIPNASVSFDVYCGLDYFTEGNQLWGVRALGENALYGSVLMYQNGSVTALQANTTGVVNPTEPDWTALAPASTEPIALFWPINGQGSFAQNISVEISSSNILSPTGFAGQSSTTGGTLTPATYQYQISAIGAQGETLVSSPVTIVIAAGTSTNSVTLTWNNVDQALGYRVYGRTTGATFGLMATIGQGTLTFTDTGAAVPDPTILPITDPADLPAASAEFIVNVYDLTQSNTYPVEQFNCTLQDFTDGNGTQTELEQRINPFSQYIQVTSNVPSLGSIPTIEDAAQTALLGGDSGSAPTSYDVANAYQVFQDKQLYQINILLNSGHADPVTQLAMDTLAQGRSDTVALLDLPSTSQQFQQAINYRNIELNLNSSYSAIFGPDVLEADTINGKQLYIPFSGWAAALCARTDRIANPSFSIAGLNRGLVNVLKSRYTFNDGQATDLFKAQVNYTRTFIGQGIALWEQQTLQAKTSALSWLSVRRMCNVMKTALYNFGLYSLQEPDDDFTAKTIISAFSTYLQSWVDARGISSYAVISDSSNNTPANLNVGVRKVRVIIVPVLPIHELDVDFVISKQGVAFSEIST